MDPQTVAEFRQRCWDKGYRPLAVYSHDVPRDKRVNKPGKQPVGGDWIQKALRDPPPASYAAPAPGQLNTGILTGEVVAIDVDVLDAATTEKIVALAAEKLGASPLVRVGRAPKILMCYRSTGGFDKLRTRAFDLSGEKAMVEVLTEGQMFVADGIHPDTKEPYRWVGASPTEVPLVELPPISAEDAAQLCEDVEKILIEAGARPQTTKVARTNGQAGEVKVAVGPYARVNAAALANIASWAPEFFLEGGSFDRQGAYRVPSSAPKLNRAQDFEEDLSVHPDGIRDFGDDRGDDTGRPLTAVAMLREHGDFATDYDAAAWLCDRLGIERPDKPKNLVPLGFTQNETFVLFDRSRGLVVNHSGPQLTSPNTLVTLAPLDEWIAAYPKKGDPGFSAMRAGDAIIRACKAVGPYNMDRVRGRGVWLEDGEVVVNLTSDVESPTRRYTYVCFEPIDLTEDDAVDAERVLEFLRMFRWNDVKEDSYLLMGWMALAPICGALKWRPHVFITGPSSSGKTQVMRFLKTMTDPLRLWVNGNGTEAGVRQRLGLDSLAVMMDEFESDRDQTRLASIMQLARSASAAEDDPVVRGTADGRKALSFCIRSSFAWAAIRLPPMDVADDSRVVKLELSPHDQDRERGKLIRSELLHFERTRGAWCRKMIGLAKLLPQAIELIETHIDVQEARHRDNMATLLAGAFLALRGRLPREDEARKTAERARAAIAGHGESFDRNDSADCLHYLYSHQVNTRVGTFQLGHFMRVFKDANPEHPHYQVAREVVGNHDVKVAQATKVGVDGQEEMFGEGAGWFGLKYSSDVLGKIFSGKKWEGGWQRSLLRIDGVTMHGTWATDKAGNPVMKSMTTNFTGKGSHKAIRIPFGLQPDVAFEAVEGVGHGGER